jgi:phage terminase large subunit-like protein
LEKYKRIPLVSMKQNGLALSEPIKNWEKEFLDGNIKTVNKDPVFYWMLQNATLKQSTSGIKKIYKPEKSNVLKIDAVITSIMGVDLANNPVMKKKKT